MAIRTTLFHNPKAGKLQHSEKEILKALREKGFIPTYVDIKAEDFLPYLDNPGELVIVAGGDGTIKKVSKHLLGKEIPIGLLPLGTANNIANSLGISGEPGNIIKSWDLSRKKPYDVGWANGPKGENIFLESMGFGLLSRLIRKSNESKSDKKSQDDELKEAYRQLIEIIEIYQAHSCTIRMDGKTLSGNYIMLEAMNIPLAGPNIKLAPQADPSDGLLDVVLVREEEREMFQSLISNMLKGESNPGKLNVQRAKSLYVEWNSDHYHIDDEACENQHPLKTEMQVTDKGLEFLLI